MTRRSGQAACLVAIALAVTAAPADATNDPAELLGRAYESKAVTRGSEPDALFEGTEIGVSFEGRDDGAVIAFHADCNFLGGPVEFADGRLIIGQLTTTEVACRRRLMRQDRWMVRFFASDPNWRAPQRGALKLTVGEREIKLRSE